MNHSDERLSSALRELAAASRQGASPELGTTLKDTFRRYHVRRRRTVRIRIALVCLCLAALAGSLLLRKSGMQSTPQQTAAIQTIPPQEVTYPADFSASKTIRPVVKKISPRPDRATPSDTFVALPSFDVLPAGDELRVVRVEMPGEDLRLVGARVEGIARRRVTADFVVGHDGTPYAVRLVRTNF